MYDAGTNWSSGPMRELGFELRIRGRDRELRGGIDGVEMKIECGSP